MDEDTTFGQWLRRRRRALDLTQSDLARLAGYSVSAIRKVEIDERKPSREMAERLAGQLRISPSEWPHALQLARGTMEVSEQKTRRPAAGDGQRRELEKAVRSIPESRQSSSAPLTNLPLSLTSFIGRAQEIAEIKSLLTTRRLVTMTGAGGCGKTRLAMQVASDVLISYPDGAWFVDLAPVNDPARVLQAVALSMGLSEMSDETILTTLTNYLRERHLLLILDNCEHLLDACASLVATWLRRCSRVTILATSRQPLRIEGEWVLRVPSLDVPPSYVALSPSNLLAYDAVRLFADRARAAGAGFALGSANATAVIEICRRLDGIPLALELAAARTSGLTVEHIARRLDQQFQLLTGGNREALPRQQTLRATLDWSYALLTESERVLFRRLGVFVGGFSVEAAEEICQGEGLERSEVLASLVALVDKSLVVMQEAGAEARYHLLEPVRQYARQVLASGGEGEAVEARHRTWYMALVGSVGNGLWDEHQAAWGELLEREHGNLRAVLAWCTEHDAATGLRIATTLSRFWIDRGHLSEGRDWLEAMLSRAPERTLTRARALLGLGYWRAFLGLDASRTVLEEAAEICGERGDQAGLGVALSNLGRLAGEAGDYRKERELDERALQLLREAGSLTEAGDEAQFGGVLADLAELADREGDYARACVLYEDALKAFRQASARRGVGYVSFLYGDLQRRMGDRQGARESLELALKLARDIRHAGNVGSTLVRLARLARDEGDLAQARATVEAYFSFAREAGRAVKHGLPLLELGKLDLLEGNLAQARSRYAESLRLFCSGSSQLQVTHTLAALGDVAAKMGERERGARLIAAASALDSLFWTSLESAERAYYEACVSTARRALGDAFFAQLWAEGQAMTLESAVSYAISHHPSPAADG